MNELWKLIKRWLLLTGGTILLFVFLTVFFDFGFKTLFSAIGIHMAGSIALLYVFIKNIWKNMQPDPIESYYLQNMKESKSKMKEIKKRIVEIPSPKREVFFTMYERMRSIYKAVEYQPSKYTQARSFFNEDVDTTLKIVDKYAYLSRQDIKSPEMKESLRNTEELVYNLKKKYETDLVELLSEDVDHLDVEVNYAKNNLDDRKPRL